MFLFALFDSLAILPLTSHVRLETGCWEEWVLFAAAAASHEWISEGRRTQYCTSVLPTLSSSLFICHLKFLLHSSGVFQNASLWHVVATTPPPSLPPRISVPPERSLWVCQCVVLESVYVRVCVYMCLVIVLYDVALLVLWSINRNACSRHLGK